MTVLLLLVMVLVMVMVVTTMITMISITTSMTSMTRRGRIISLITGKMKMDMKKMNQCHLSETQPKQPKVTSNYTNSWAPQRCSGLAVGAKARLCGSLLVRCWSKATGSNEGALKQKSCLQWLDSLWVFPHGSFMEVCFKIRNFVKIMWKMMMPLPFWCNVLNRIVQSPSQILTIFRLKIWTTPGSTFTILHLCQIWYLRQRHEVSWAAEESLKHLVRKTTAALSPPT